MDENVCYCVEDGKVRRKLWIFFFRISIACCSVLVIYLDFCCVHYVCIFHIFDKGKLKSVELTVIDSTVHPSIRKTNFTCVLKTDFRID